MSTRWVEPLTLDYRGVTVCELPVGNVDVKIVVTRDGERLGVVKISRGSIDWKPGKAKRTWSLTWQQFDDLMREHGHPPR